MDSSKKSTPFWTLESQLNLPQCPWAPKPPGHSQVSVQFTPGSVSSQSSQTETFVGFSQVLSSCWMLFLLRPSSVQELGNALFPWLPKASLQSFLQRFCFGYLMLYNKSSPNIVAQNNYFLFVIVLWSVTRVGLGGQFFCGNCLGSHMSLRSFGNSMRTHEGKFPLFTRLEIRCWLLAWSCLCMVTCHFLNGGKSIPTRGSWKLQDLLGLSLWN